jgi:hypothetical protein
MIGHQAPGPDVDMILLAPQRHQFDVGQIIVITEKGLLATITALGDVMWVARGYYSCNSCHGERVAALVEESQ